MMRAVGFMLRRSAFPVLRYSPLQLRFCFRGAGTQAEPSSAASSGVGGASPPAPDFVSHAMDVGQIIESLSEASNPEASRQAFTAMETLIDLHPRQVWRMLRFLREAQAQELTPGTSKPDSDVPDVAMGTAAEAQTSQQPPVPSPGPSQGATEAFTGSPLWFTLIVLSMVRKGHMFQAMSVVMDMEEHGPTPTEDTFVALVSHCKDPDMLVHALQRATAASPSPCVRVVRCVMIRLLEMGEYARIVDYFVSEEAPDQASVGGGLVGGGSDGSGALEDVVARNVLISAAGRVGKLDLAWKVYQGMTVPQRDEGTYGALMLAARRNGDVDLFQRTHSEALKAGYGDTAVVQRALTSQV